MPDRPTTGTLEQRALLDGAPPVIDGRRLRGIVPYGVESRDLGGWREVIEPGALRNANLDDLVATVDHAGVPIGRHPSTLHLDDLEDGLHWSVDLPESRADIREAIERGDLRSASWRMVVTRDEWRGPVRHVHEIGELRDVAVVTAPAYPAARAELRNNPQPPAEPADRPEAPVIPPTQSALRVEDRERHVTPASVESRVTAAMASVLPGEMRDLTHATTDPVQPDDLRTQLIDALRANAVVLQAGANLVTTDKKSVKWPILTGDVTVAFYDELDEIAESDVTLDDFEIPVKKLAAMVRGSSEAFEDSDPDLLRIVSENINTAMALKGDRELVVGNDAKGFKGLLNVTGTQSIAVGGALSWDHVIKAVGMLSEAMVPGPYAILLGPRPATALALVKTESGSNEYLARPDGVPPVFSTAWLPVTTGGSPTTSAIVFAPQQATVVVRRQVTVEVDRSGDAFDTDAVKVRGKYRLGMDIAHPGSIVKLTGISAPAIS